MARYFLSKKVQKNTKGSSVTIDFLTLGQMRVVFHNTKEKNRYLLVFSCLFSELQIVSVCTLCSALYIMCSRCVTCMGMFMFMLHQTKSSQLESLVYAT